ncbi:MAG: hypothetical protein ACYDAR_20245 [Thermomicrobiales bacterium]
MSIAFGRVEQRELEYLRLLRVDPLDRLIFAVLRVRYDARRGAVMDKIGTLADWSGMSERKVQACLQSLVRRGIITRLRRPAGGGQPGHAWSWSTTVCPYEGWPWEPLAVLVVASVAYISVFLNAQNTHDERALRAKKTHRTTEEDAQNGRGARTATRHNQESYPETYQDVTSVASLTDAEDDEEEGVGADVERALNVLRRAQWYPFDGARDRIILATATASGHTDLVEDIRRWVERGNGDEPNHPRSALVGWLTKGARLAASGDIGTHDRIPSEAEQLAALEFKRRPTPENWAALQEAREC